MFYVASKLQLLITAWCVCVCVCVYCSTKRSLTMGRLAQFRLLLWKNYLFQRRKVLVTLIEIGLPTLFALILIFVRMRVESNKIANPTSWTEFAINDKYGTWDWMSEGPWEIYFTPNSTAAREVMPLAVKQLRRLCDPGPFGCVSG